MAGYDGYSMSNNARAAYASDEKPFSKWTKTEILEAAREIAEDNEINIDFDLFSKISVNVLKSAFLEKTSWHHTSKFYNRTDFYSINEEKICELTNDELLRLSKIRIKSEKPKKSAKEKETTEQANIIYDKLNIIYLSNITKLKSFGSVVRRYTSGKIDLEKAYSEAVETIRSREKVKVDCWRKLPTDHWRQECVRKFDTDIETYISYVLVSSSTRNRTTLAEIKETISREIAREL